MGKDESPKSPSGFETEVRFAPPRWARRVLKGVLYATGLFFSLLSIFMSDRAATLVILGGEIYSSSVESYFVFAFIAAVCVAIAYSLPEDRA